MIISGCNCEYPVTVLATFTQWSENHIGNTLWKRDVKRQFKTVTRQSNTGGQSEHICIKQLSVDFKPIIERSFTHSRLQY